MRGRASIAALGGAAADSCSRWAIAYRESARCDCANRVFHKCCADEASPCLQPMKLPGQMFVGHPVRHQKCDLPFARGRCPQRDTCLRALADSMRSQGTACLPCEMFRTQSIRLSVAASLSMMPLAPRAIAAVNLIVGGPTQSRTPPWSLNPAPARLDRTPSPLRWALRYRAPRHRA